MKLLERFRSTPEWQSDDPLVRAAAVRDLPDGEGARELLAEIARTDAHPAVRCQAVARIDDVDTLVSILNADSDADVKLEAAASIRDLVIDAENSHVAVRGVEALQEERDLVAVAREARLDDVGRLALSRLSSPRALGLVARRAGRSDLALEALARVDDPGELQAVAVKAEDRAIALSAFERLLSHDVPRETFEQMAKRARQKAVQRRARAVLSGGSADADGGREQESAATPHADLCVEIERMSEEPDLERGRSTLEQVLKRWSDLDPMPDPEMLRRFSAGRHAAEAHLAELEATQTEATKQLVRQRGAVEQREALCARVERMPGFAPVAELEAIRTEWAGLPDGDDTGEIQQRLVSVRQRFDSALAQLETRRSAYEGARQAVVELETVADELHKLIEAGTVTGRVWSTATHRWDAQVSRLGDDSDALGPELQAQWASLRRRREELETRRRTMLDETRAERERAEKENFERVSQRIKTAEGLVKSEKLTLAEGERQLRALRRLQADPGGLPPRSRESLLRELKDVQTSLVGRVRELRDFSDWQRWANLGIQERLCGRMEALKDVPSDQDSEFLSLFQEIMAEWRQAADVPKDRGADLWARFKVAHDAVQARYETCRAAAAVEREANASRQRAIVEEAEQLASSSDWLKTVQRITELQAEWKSIGSSPRKEQRALWNRFRAASNTFFARRKADLATRKQEWARNLKLKEELCARVEALATAEDIGAATAEVKQVQAEWKTVGPVRRNRADAIWKRFRTACDAVFERVHAGDREEMADRVQAREALCVELEALAGEKTGTESVPLVDVVREMQKKWREIPEVPPAVARKLATRFGTALTTLVETQPEAFRDTELDPARTLKRLETLCERVEALRPSTKSGEQALSPAELLASKWRDALASNLMGARVDEGAERRAAADQVRRAKQELRRLGPLPGDQGRELTARFHTACEHVLRWADPSKREAKPEPRKKPQRAQPPRNADPAQEHAEASMGE